MPNTHFPYGISSYGVPVLPGPGVAPNFKPNANPAHNSAGYAGVLFVNADFGSDANDGLTPGSALKNLDTAFNYTLGGCNEIIYVLGGSAAVSYSTKIASGGAGLNWNKNYTHCIGLSGPNPIGGRARITNGASTFLLTPLLTVSAIGCLFQNLEIENVGSDAALADVNLAVTGVRNSFINCQISGGVGTTTTGEAGMRSLLIGGTVAGTGTAAADENFFQHCYIGLDTESRTSTSAEIEILNSSARNIFEDCIIATYGTGGQFFLKIGATGIDRFVAFRKCQFINAYTFSGGTILSDAFSVTAAPGGLVLLSGGCVVVGATALSASDTAIFSGDPIPSVSGGKAIAMTW